MKYYEHGSLKQFLHKNSNLTSNDNTTVQIIITGIVCGMKYLHSQDIIHRDLKPENILLDEHNEPYICDFGCSKIIETHSTQGYLSSQTGFIGTLIYMSPECLSAEENYDGKLSDVYSFGITLYEILTRTIPYSNYPNLSLLAFMKKIVYQQQRPEFPSDIEIKQEYRYLIERCWSHSPTDRPTFDEIYSLLTTNSNYRLDKVDKDRYEEYINKIQ